jgi:Xaa-Pro aminopeptidase
MRPITRSAIDHALSTDFTADEFLRRRQTIASEIGPSASALLQGAPRAPTAHPRFQQSKIFYYVCGVSIERCYLLIEGESAKTTLFVPSSKIGGMPGGALDDDGMAEIRSRMKIDEVTTVENLARSLEAARTLYVLHKPDELVFSTRFGIVGSGNLRAEDPLERHRRRDEVLIDRLTERFPKVEIADLCPIIEKMRLIKSPAEIELLRTNGRMAAQVLIECMKSTKPGVPGSTLEAICDYVFRFMGNCDPAYEFMLEPSSGSTEKLVDGDMVLVDCAPDHGYYTMDIARIWPVNGRYDEWQRHTVGLITEYHKVLLALGKPGRRLKEIYDEAAKLMLAKYEGDDAGTAILNNMIAKGINYYNHHIGLSAHDAVCFDRDAPLQAGMAMVVDPMVWLDGAPHRYVRIEDAVVITDEGCERLTGAVPIELDEIEALMAQPGRFPLEL